MANPTGFLKKKKEVPTEPVTESTSSTVKHLLRKYDFTVVDRAKRRISKLINEMYGAKYKELVTELQEILEQYDYKDNLILDICGGITIQYNTLPEFLSALYVICCKFELSYKKLIKSLFIDSEEGNGYRTICTDISFSDYTNISFSDFEFVCEAAKDYGFSELDARLDICDIFEAYFIDFIENATEKDIKILKYIDENWQAHVNFGDCLYEAFTAANSVYYFDCTDIKYAKFMVKFYPELFAVVCTRTLINIIGLAGEKSIYADDGMDEEFDEYYKVKELLLYMADYAKYHSVEFEVKKYWKHIISSIMTYCDGVTLNLAVEVFKEEFNISLDEMENHIASFVLLLLNGDKTKYYDEYGGFKANEFSIDSSKIANEFGYKMLEECASSKWENIIRLLPNPVAFEVVMAERQHFICNFNHRAEY